MKNDLWETITRDPRVHLGKFKHDKRLKSFIVDSMETALHDVIDETCSISTLMEAQYRCIDALARQSPKSQGALSKIRNSLSQYEDAEMFLSIAGTTVQDFCCGRSYMTLEEYQEMIAGTLLIRDILKKHPTVILAPLLRELKTLH